MKQARLARLERLVRAWICPTCGLTPPLPCGLVPDSELEGLGKAEREELLGLLGLTVATPCARCGRAGRDMSRLTDDQLDRAIALLRVVVGSENSLSDLWGVGDADRRPT